MKKTSIIIITVLICTVQVFGIGYPNYKSSNNVYGVRGNSINDFTDFVKA